jgi:hypothetical protein
MLHKQALDVKKMQTSLKGMLDEDIKTVNHIKSMPLKTKLFKTVCKGMGSEYTALLLHTEGGSQGEKCLSEFLSLLRKFCFLCTAPNPPVKLFNMYHMVTKIGILYRNFHED